MTAGDGGAGSVNHLAGELLQQMAGVKWIHVHHKGIAPAISDVLGGHIDVMISQVIGTMQHIQRGGLRALATTGPVRLRQLPDLPTMQESGVPGYVFDSWYGLLAPRGTPEPVLARLHQAVVQALQSKELLARLSTEAAEPVGSTPQQFTQYLSDEVEKYARLVKELGLQAD